MNKAMLIGRLTRDPDIRYNSQADGNQLCIARYTLAVDRRGRTAEGQQSADFISCVCFGKTAEFVEKYLIQGTKVAVVGRIQTGSYTNKDGAKVYTTDIVVEEMEFCEKKADSGQPQQEPQKPQDDTSAEGFMTIPENAADDLPFKNKK